MKTTTVSAKLQASIFVHSDSHAVAEQIQSGLHTLGVSGAVQYVDTTPDPLDSTAPSVQVMAAVAKQEMLCFLNNFQKLPAYNRHSLK